MLMLLFFEICVIFRFDIFYGKDDAQTDSKESSTSY